MKISLKKCKKGEYGYLDYQHFYSSLRALLVFLVALIIFFAGYLYYGNKENIVTVLSVLTLLPASHMLVLCIMYWRFSTGSEEFYKKASKILDGDCAQFYDSVITIEKGGSYPVNLFVCIEKTLIAYTEIDYGASGIIEKHIKSMLSSNQINGVSVKVFTKEDAFLNRLSELKGKFATDNEIKDVDFQTIALIKALSL